MQGNPKPKSSPECYILISENEKLKEQLEFQLKKPVIRQDIAQSFSQKLQTEIIFDQNFLDFKTIIEVMQANKTGYNTFKILPKSADFMIGSNSSFDRGEVVEISNSTL